MATLTSTISTWRAANQGDGTGHAGLLSKLKINTALYDIKDPAVDALASAIDTELTTIKDQLTSATTWNPVTKGENVGKFATSVTQAADGSITVEYADILGSAYSSGAAGQFVTGVYQAVDGSVTAALGTVGASDVTATFTGASNVQDALDALYAKDLAIIGSSADATSVDSIWAAKNYVDEQVALLAGEDWSQNAGTVKQIIDELSQGGTDAMGTIIDKIRGNFDIIDPETGGTSSSDIKTYIDTKLAEVASAASGGITDLDAVETGSTSHVSVTVTEVDGVITDVTVTETDIASATGLAALDGAAVKSVNGETGNSVTLDGSNIYVTGTSGTTIAQALNSKFDANSIGQTSVKNWEASYVSDNEELAWTSQNVTVYAPTSAGA